MIDCASIFFTTRFAHSLNIYNMLIDYFLVIGLQTKANGKSLQKQYVEILL